MKEARTHRSVMDPSMDTENRGSIMPQGDSNMEQGPNRAGRKAYVEPHEFVAGPQGEIGVGSNRSVNKWDGNFHDDEMGLG